MIEQTPDLDAAALDVQRLANEAQAELDALIAKNGTATAAQVLAIQTRFDAAFLQTMARHMSVATGDPWNVRMAGEIKVGNISLSASLYANAQQTANEVAALVRLHANGINQARDLAIRLYDGYHPGDGITRPLEGAARAKLPQALRQLTANATDRASLQAVYEQGMRYAANLKTEALKAAYLGALKTWDKDKGAAALARALDIAHREKTRYMANRIAQTELARAHQKAVAETLMADATIDVVQVLMSAAHPKMDVCALHAKANLFDLGPGCYPKGRGPVPPYHCFCRCRLRSRPDLQAAHAREKPGGEAAYLRSLSPKDAAKVMGGKPKLQRMLNGEKFDTVINSTKDPLYRLERMGAMGPETKSSKIKSSALQEAISAPAAWKLKWKPTPCKTSRRT